MAQQRVTVAPLAMQAVAPALVDFTDHVLFGDVWKRPELSPRDRSLVTVAVLIATGKTAQLEGHVGRALDNGVRPSEIAELATHLAFYAGWPDAVSSLEVIERVFASRSIDPAALRATPAPAAPVPASDVVAREREIEKQIAPFAPKLAQLTRDVLFDDLWQRPNLSPRDRSLVTIAALAANGDEDQLAPQVQRGMENGLTRDEIGEALTHLAFYAGWPRATAAVAVAAKTFTGQTVGAEPEASETSLRIVPPGGDPTRAPAEHFTGVVTVSSPFSGKGSAQLGGSTVTFQPGARTNWHTHPFGQLLIITAGRGWVQAEGGAVRAVGPGDVVWTPPGVKHWHGATRTSSMTHVAVAESQEGSKVQWFEPVSDMQYHGPE
jgi:4-carboxymuconolactone decarboxylase